MENATLRSESRSVTSPAIYGRKMVIYLIKGYQLLISPFLPPCCRFTPSCSEYSQQALSEYGLRKGLLLAGGRLLRCHPFSAGGYDPLPHPKED